MSDSFNVIDSNSLSKEQIKTLQDVALYLESINQPMISELIKQKYALKDFKLYDMNLSDFAKKCEEYNLSYAIQGYVSEGDVRYPILCITEDIRKFDEFLSKTHQ